MRVSESEKERERDRERGVKERKRLNGRGRAGFSVTNSGVPAYLVERQKSVRSISVDNV